MMDNNQKHAIRDLRSRGVTYLQIADRLGLSMNTVKSFCRRNDVLKRLCKNCGKPLESAVGRKPKTFCGDHCRQTWWRTNRDQMRKNAVYHFTCANCRRPFSSYGNRNRRYCSHDCYISQRFGVP